MFRGVASIAVLLAHVAQILLYRLLGADDALALMTGTIARHAVLVFFLLSGYLVTQSIISNVKRNGYFDVSEYLSSRIARVYPPLIGAIILVLSFWAIIYALDLPGSQRYGLPGDLYTARDAYHVSFMDVPRALLMMNGMLDANGPLWSLYIEFHIYLIAMFAAMAMCSGKRMLWGAISLILLLNWIHADSSFLFFALVWALGAAVILVKNRLTELGAANRLKVLTYSLAALLLGAILIAPGMFSVDNPDPWIAYGVQMGCCVVYAGLIFLNDGFAMKPKNFLVQTGNFSYSLYVIHFPILLLTLSITQNYTRASFSRSLFVSIMAIVVAIVGAALFARLFEDQRRFKPYIKTALNAIPALNRK